MPGARFLVHPAILHFLRVPPLRFVLWDNTCNQYWISRSAPASAFGWRGWLSSTAVAAGFWRSFSSAAAPGLDCVDRHCAAATRTASPCGRTAPTSAGTLPPAAVIECPWPTPQAAPSPLARTPRDRPSSPRDPGRFRLSASFRRWRPRASLPGGSKELSWVHQCSLLGTSGSSTAPAAPSRGPAATRAGRRREAGAPATAARRLPARVPQLFPPGP